MGLFWPYHKVILLIVAVYYLGKGWLGLCRRHPLVAWFTLGFIQGLLSGRRRRRW
jgi:hypothetical protein